MKRNLSLIKAGLMVWVKCVVASSFVMAQGIISGTVNDPDRSPLANAGLILTSLSEQSPVSYLYSDARGRFAFSGLSSGRYMLEVSCLGYETKRLEINARDQVEVILERKSLVLNEVIIQPERPVKVSDDTVSVLTDFFTNGTEQNVEDLLRKIPGLAIEEDGTIRVGNREVEKVMVEGDDFFEKGYKLLTKNMAAYPVNKVEIYRNYSRNKHLKGIENSDKVALNLSLREEIKSTWFGNGSVGYGGKRFQAQGNLMNFGRRSKYYFLTHSNNTGEDVQGGAEQFFAGEEEESAEDHQPVRPISALSTGFPDLKKQRVNFNNARLFSLNGIFAVSDKIKLKTLGLMHFDRSSHYKSSRYGVSAGSVLFENSEVFRGSRTQVGGFGSAELTYDISPEMTLLYTGKGNRWLENTGNELQFNATPLREQLEEEGFRREHRLQLTRKINANKVLMYTGSYFSAKTPQQYTLSPFVYENLFSEQGDEVYQTATHNSETLKAEIQLMHKKENEGLLELRGGIQRRKEVLVTGYTACSTEAPRENTMHIMSHDVYWTTKYLRKVDRFQFLAQGELHGLFYQLTGENHIARWYMVPKLGVTYFPGKGQKIQSSYTYLPVVPGIMDLHSQYIHSGFRIFSKGTEEFDLVNTSTWLLNYSAGSWGSRFFLNTFVVYTQNHKFLSTNTLLSPGYSRVEKIWGDRRESVSAFASADRFFPELHSNLKITMSLATADFRNRVNGSHWRQVNTVQQTYGWENRSAFRFFLNYHVGSKWMYRQVRSESSRAFTDRRFFADLDCRIGKRFHFKMQSERYYFGMLDKGYVFLDAEARYSFRKPALVLYLVGNNLFNTRTFRDYTVSDVSYTRTEYRLQTRLVMLKGELRF